MQLRANKHQLPNTIDKPVVKLLGAGDQAEIIQYEIGKGRHFFISPALNKKAYECYYIVKGKLTFNDICYTTNDYFDVITLDEDVKMTMLEDTVILLFSSRTGEYDSAYMRNEIIVTKLEAIQKKDHYTFEHCNRVKKICVAIGEALKLSVDDIMKLTFSAYFHDVGKINVDDSILNKPSKLTLDEYTTMKEHVLHSYNIIKTTSYDYLADIVILHHERLDGSGYPNGLTEIPLLGRILGIADSFDAMTTDRVYKKGKTVSVALAELQSLNHLYDPVLVDLLASLIRSGELL